MTGQRAISPTSSSTGPSTAAGSHPASEPLDPNALLDDRRRQIIVCCGSGGVGKTTTAAALALRAAERGRRVVVLTIDPARRLAQALGLQSLDNTPRRVPGIRGDGSLDAMMLDMKRTFDEIVLTHASPSQAEEILANPFYQALSSSFAGTQEYMAMERLAQLYARTVAGRPTDQAADSTDDEDTEPPYDLIVVDTPPSRSALDFLDAPNRLSSFLDSRLLKLLTTPARGPLKLFSAGVAGASGVLAKVLGTEVLNDVRTFVSSLDSTFGGFRERAEATYALLQQPSTAFLVVAAPETDALREASFFLDRLRDESMPLAGLVLNRTVTVPADTLSAERSLSAAEALAERLGTAGNDADTTPDTPTGGRTGNPGGPTGSTPAVPPEQSPHGSDEAATPAGERGQADDPNGSAADLRTTVALLRLHADRVRLAERQRRLAERFAAAHPGVPTIELPSLATDVHDLEALRAVLAEAE